MSTDPAALAPDPTTPPAQYPAESEPAFLTRARRVAHFNLNGGE